MTENRPPLSREALRREWTEHGLIEYVRYVCAQEDGSKKDCIRALSPHYPAGHVLMMGDAPGDPHEVLFGDPYLDVRFRMRFRKTVGTGDARQIRVDERL